MNQAVDLEQIARRPSKYWNADGLPELVMGLLWIVWGGAWLFGQTLPRGGQIWNIYWMFTPAFLAFSGVGAIWLIKKLKARLTFPRTGYVAWKEPTGRQRATAAAVSLVAASALAMIVAKGRANGVEQVAVPGLTVLLSLAFVVASITQRAPHLLALAGVTVMLGLAFAALRTGWDAMNWMLVALGAASAGLGLIRLVLFLQRHPAGVEG